MKQVVKEGGTPCMEWRHTFASNLFIAKVSDVKVGRWLGHADARMVHRHYSHLFSYDCDIYATRIAVPAPSEG